VGSIAFRTVIS